MRSKGDPLLKKSDQKQGLFSQITGERSLGQRLDFGFNTGQFLLSARHILPQASGDVLELQVGGGRNLQYYKPHHVRTLVGVDVNPRVRQFNQRAEAVEFPVEIVAAQPHALSLPNESVDCVVSTYTLSGVQYPNKVMSEIWRVLKPGGLLLFCEQGRHPSRHVAYLQDKITPFWRRLSFGRALNLNMFRLISGAGFKIDLFEMDRLPFKPTILGYHYAGVAVKAA